MKALRAFHERLNNWMPPWMWVLSAVLWLALDIRLLVS